jgi:hypothetical protein
VIEAYKKVPPKPYDFESDPMGVGVWVPLSRVFAANNPLALVLPPHPTKDDVMRVVLEICRQYAFLIEYGGLSEGLYQGPGRPRHESFAQKLFYGIAYAYCKANDLDISPETNSGRGSVDFKFSHGFNAKVVVEVKLTSNQRLEHGFTVQVEEYAKAEQTDQRVFLVIDVEKVGTAERLAAFKLSVAELELTGKSLPVVMHVNGRLKSPASKYAPAS